MVGLRVAGMRSRESEPSRTRAALAARGSCVAPDCQCGDTALSPPPWPSPTLSWKATALGSRSGATSMQHRLHDRPLPLLSGLLLAVWTRRGGSGVGNCSSSCLRRQRRWGLRGWNTPSAGGRRCHRRRSGGFAAGMEVQAGAGRCLRTWHLCCRELVGQWVDWSRKPLVKLQSCRDCC